MAICTAAISVALITTVVLYLSIEDRKDVRCSANPLGFIIILAALFLLSLLITAPLWIIAAIVRSIFF